MKIYYMELCIFSKNFRLLKNKFKDDNNYKTISNISRLFSDYILSNELKVDPGTIEYFYNLNGKPYIKNRNDIFFSVSNTNDIIAIAVSNNPIGIDVEQIIKLNNKNCYLLEVLNNTELNFIETLKEKEASKYLFETWTQKESYLKYVGSSINDDVKNLNIISKGNYKSLLVNGEEQNVYIQSIDYLKNHIFSICTQNFEIFVLKKITLKKFINELEEYL